MSSWHSLQGYLGYRSSGALGRLKGKKRLWFVFDDPRCRLLSYKNEVEAGCRTKSPVGTIDMRSAAIALNVTDPNQFVIHSLGKEYFLSAETHESTMIWLLALQAKRDAFNNELTLFVDQTPVDYKEREEMKRKESLPSDTELRQMIHRAMCAENGGLSRPPPLSKSAGPPPQPPSSSPSLHRSQSVREQRTSGSSYRLLDSSAGKRSKMIQFDRSLLHPGASVVHGHRQSIDLGSFTTGTRPLEILDSRARSAGSLATTDSEDTELLATAAGTTTIMDEVDDWFPVDSGLVFCSPRRLESEDVNEDADDEYRLGHVTTNDCTSQRGDNRVGPISDKERIRELENLLVSAKVELTNSLSRESSMQDALEDREARLRRAETAKSGNGGDASILNGRSGSPSCSTASSHEKCRILQNQNRFLNEEVLKLSRMWQQEKMNYLQQCQRLRESEIGVDHLKQDYVFLLQSSIRTAGGEGPDFIEVPIYGGSKHKDRVSRLLDEARKVNPSLPSLEGMAKSGCHVDSYGFRHCYTNEGLMLHYLCGQLHQHYSSQLASAERNQRRWKELLQKSGTDGLVRTKEVKRLVRGGIPNHLRAKVWGLLVQERVRDIREGKGPLYYGHLCSLIADSETVARHRRQISLDLLRTMPSNVHFSECDSDGVKKMQEVLQVFCLHNPEVGYCQGMNFIVGMALLFMKPDEAFWFLVAITERYFQPHYFDQNLMGAQADQDVLKNLLAVKMPDLAQHLQSLDIEISTVTLNWFLSIFFDSVPLETLLRIWDCFLYEGPKVLFRFSLAILKMTESCLLERHDTISVMRQLKASSRLCYDVEGLMRTAFEDLKPFPRRSEIVSKQACYLKTLKEKHKKRNLELEVLETKEKLLDAMEAANMAIECATVVGHDVLWLCEGHQSRGRVMEVHVDDGSMQWLDDIQLESRIMCVHCVPNAGVVLLGSLSRFLYAYGVTTRELIWKTPVNDSVLDVCSHTESGGERIYAALADGTVAVIERPFVATVEENRCATDSDYDVFYIMIGSGPVSSLCVVDKRLWCACGNRVVILHARTLDIIDQFTVSGNSLDIVSSLTDSRHGVWILLRGSSTFQLWDPQNLVCRTMYDVKENRCPRIAHETQFSAGWRVTAILPLDSSLWVGTGDGHLFVYDIHRLRSRSPSAFNSPGVTGDGHEGLAASLDLVTMRIEELYLNQNAKGGGGGGLADDGDRCGDGGQKQQQEGIGSRGRSDSGYQTLGDGSKDSSASQHERESVQEDGGSNSKRDSGDFEEEVVKEAEADAANSAILENGDGDKEEAAVVDSSAAASSSSSQSEGSPFSEKVEQIPPSLEAAVATLQMQRSTGVVKGCVAVCKNGKKKANGIQGDGQCCPTKCTARKSALPRRRTLEKVSRRHLSHSMSTYELSSKFAWNERRVPSSSSSLSTSPMLPQKTNCRSYDDVLHLLGGSGDSLFSSPTCDSFDFDDVFVSYTEDETRIRAVVHKSSQEMQVPSLRLPPPPPAPPPRFILLTDDGSTCGADGGSSSGGGKIAGRGVAVDEAAATAAAVIRKPDLLGKTFFNRRRKTNVDRSVVRRRREKRSSGDGAPSKPATAAAAVVSPPLLVIGSHEAKVTADPNEQPEGPRLPGSGSSASSLEDLSSVSHVEYDSVQDAMARNRAVDRLTIGVIVAKDGFKWKGSDSGSFVSFSESDVPYSVELTLRDKQKISDRPVRAIIGLPCESLVISCAGSCGDSRSILKWTADKSCGPLMWKSRAMVVCSPHSTDNSDKGLKSVSRSTSPSTNSIVHATSNLVGSGLARVQTMISNLGSDNVTVSSNV